LTGFRTRHGYTAYKFDLLSTILIQIRRIGIYVDAPLYLFSACSLAFISGSDGAIHNIYRYHYYIYY